MIFKKSQLDINSLPLWVFTDSERDWPSAWRVNHAEEVDTKGNDTNVCLAVLRNKESESSEKQEDCHEWEARQKQISPTECVNSLQCW